jgi:hypothetical protein
VIAAPSRLGVHDPVARERRLRPFRVLRMVARRKCGPRPASFTRADPTNGDGIDAAATPPAQPTLAKWRIRT